MIPRIAILLLISLLGILLSDKAVCYADEEEEVYKAKENICSLIDKGKFAEAKSEAEKMAIEFAGQGKLPEMLYWVAERYERNDQFDKAQLFYQRVIQDYPENQHTDKARLNAAKSEIMALIMAERYDEAKAALDRHITDFASQSDLHKSLFWIAERYQRMDKFDEAKQLYQRIIENYPNNIYANKAKLWLSRTNVTSLIVSGSYPEAREALDKLVTDFDNSADLPEALFWITERYERQSRLEEAVQNYQRIIQNFPYNTWAKRAKLGIPRAKAIYLIESGDFNQADEAINKMASDFTKHSDIPWTLYLIAERYKKVNRSADANCIYQQIVQEHPDSLYASKVKTELGQSQGPETQNQFSAEAEKKAVELYRLARQYEDSNDVALAKQTYQRVINEYPGTIKADNSAVDIRRLAILEKLQSGDANQAGVLIEQFAADFKGRHNLSVSAFNVGEVCYEKYSLLEKAGQGSSEQARKYLAMTVKMLDIVINEMPSSREIFYALYIDGCCHYQLGDYQKSADMLQKLADDFPDYERAWYALFLAAESYQGLKMTGAMPASEADLQTLSAYVRLLRIYPDCPVAAAAQRWVDKQKTNKGENQ
ncbi:MAG: tetratricopeptide repeat protein [Sedimentisphaerales bacterium]|nr:tetratricopeptide repeat protein [Sedimentisphaerales bacterium]